MGDTRRQADPAAKGIRLAIDSGVAPPPRSASADSHDARGRALDLSPDGLLTTLLDRALCD